jgi:hypothetical protein
MLCSLAEKQSIVNGFEVVYTCSVGEKQGNRNEVEVVCNLSVILCNVEEK